MANECEKLEKFKMEHECPTKVCEEIVITVPITIKAESEVGTVKVCCKGCPVIHDDCGCDERSGRIHEIKKFTVSQRLEVEIPLEFEAEVEVGEGHVEFDEPTDDCNPNTRCDCDCGCDKD